MIFDDVFVPHERVFLAGEVEEGGFLTTSYATHHRHSCIGARAGFGDLLIGAGALMIEANGLDPDRHGHIRDAMVELITITESFFACGVAASVYGQKDPAGSIMPEPVFANIGKLLLATKIYDMHRVAHYVSGGLIVALPGPDEDHNPETQASLSAVLAGRPDIPAAQRLEVARFIEDLTASHQGGWYSLISLHGGGSPEAMKREIWRNYPIRRKGGAGRAAARPRRARRGAARVEAAGPLLRHRLRGAEPAGGRRIGRGSAHSKSQNRGGDRWTPTRRAATRKPTPPGRPIRPPSGPRPPARSIGSSPPKKCSTRRPAFTAAGSSARNATPATTPSIAT